MMLWWMVAALAAPQASEPWNAQITRRLGDGVEVDWTDMMVKLRVRQAPPSKDLDTRAAEQLAIDAITVRIGAFVDDVWVRDGVRVDDVPSSLGQITDDDWHVFETTYRTDHSVEVTGALMLQHALGRWSRDRALVSDVVAADHGEQFSGLVLDARGLKAQPSYAPVLQDAQGVVWDARMRIEEVMEKAPVRWVPDPAHPAAGRAGGHPMFARVLSFDGTTLVLSDADGQRIRDAFAEDGVLAQGTVVVVVDR